MKTWISAQQIAAANTREVAGHIMAAPPISAAEQRAIRQAVSR